MVLCVADIQYTEDAGVVCYWIMGKVRERENYGEYNNWLCQILYYPLPGFSADTCLDALVACS